MFAWSDTKVARPDSDSRAYAVPSEADNTLNPDLVGAHQHYEIRAIAWSQRDRFVRELAGWQLAAVFLKPSLAALPLPRRTP